MARTFGGSPQRLEYYAGSVGVSAYPLTMACWAKPSAGAPTQALFSLKRGAASDDRDHLTLTMNSSAAGRFCIYSADNAGAGGNVAATAGFTVGAWHHVCGVFASTSSRAIYMNGGSKGTNAAAIGAAGAYDRIGVGWIDQASAYYLNGGDVAECAFWNVALTDTDVAVLALGVSPLLVQPAALVFYAPLLGSYSPEIDVKGGRGLNLSGTVAASPHPPVSALTWQRYGKRAITYAVAGTTKNQTGTIVPSARVLLFRTSDNAFISETTSDGSGHYSFTVPNNTTTYYVVAYKAGSPDVMGTTVNTLRGA